MLNLLLMMNLLTFPLYVCAFYMMVLCAIKRLQHQVRWQYTKQTPKGGTHGYLSDVSKVAVANICPWCRQVYHTIQSAKEHIRRKLRTGQCTGRGSAVVYQVVPPSQLCCPTCDVVFGSVDELLAHVVSHVQLPVA